MRKYTTELIGTFFLVFTVCTAVLSGAALAPLAIGLVLTTMVFAGGHISGAHYNPAVTVAVWLRGRLATRDIGPYIAAQVVGALVAAGLARLVVDKTPGPAFHVTGRHLLGAFVAAIGGTVLAGAVAVGDVSGGVFNPAVAVGVSTAGLISWSMIWVYLIANFGGGALAAFAFRALNPDDLEVPAPVEEVPGEKRSRSLPMSGFKRTRASR